MKSIKIILFFILLVAAGSYTLFKKQTYEQIRPWNENRLYWQYKGKPVLLLGATDNDNLFQNHNLESHLNSLHMVGGNCVRNTMSDHDPGNIVGGGWIEIESELTGSCFAVLKKTDIL